MLRGATKFEIQSLRDELAEIQEGLGKEGSWLNKLYLTKSPKKDAILRWAEILEELHNKGEYAEPIWTISGTIQSWFRQKKMNEAIEYVRTVLPFKYKNQQKNTAGSSQASDDQHRTNSSLNELYRKDIKKDIKLLKKLHKFLTKTKFEDAITKKELDEYFLRKRQMRELIGDIMDGRQDVLTNTQHLMFYCFTESTKNFTFSKYILEIKKFAEISGKQAKKLLSGRVKNLQDLLEPKSSVEAQNYGFSGVQCGTCGGFRVEEKFNYDKSEWMMFCYGNHKRSEPVWFKKKKATYLVKSD